MKITTAGESHGKGLFCIIEGLPSHLLVDFNEISRCLALRQSGYGRGARQKIECDKAEFLSGVRGGYTLGSPVTIAVYNKDYENWAPYMAAEECDLSARKLTKVRPGHADLAGLLKYGGDDARNILERASARESAVRVAAGTLLRGFLRALGVEITGYTVSVAGVCDEGVYSFEEIEKNRLSELCMMNNEVQSRAMQIIDECKEKGDTCGGVIEIRVKGLKSGFGSCMTYREKLDARLCGELMSIQAIKGVQVGLGFEAASMYGSAVHDEIYKDDKGYHRKTNRAGGIEGGMSNGEEIILRCAMKPIPTLMKGLSTVDYATGEQTTAAAERSDVCAISACEIICESAVATVLSEAVLERLGGDTMQEVIERYRRLP